MREKSLTFKDVYTLPLKHDDGIVLTEDYIMALNVINEYRDFEIDMLVDILNGNKENRLNGHKFQYNPSRQVITIDDRDLFQIGRAHV